MLEVKSTLLDILENVFYLKSRSFVVNVTFWKSGLTECHLLPVCFIRKKKFCNFPSTSIYQLNGNFDLSLLVIVIHSTNFWGLQRAKE